MKFFHCSSQHTTTDDMILSEPSENSNGHTKLVIDECPKNLGKILLIKFLTKVSNLI